MYKFSHLAILLMATFSLCAIADVQDIDSGPLPEDIDTGAPETTDDAIRRSVTPPQYQPQQNNNQNRTGAYLYNGYPYPFIYPYGGPWRGGAVGNVNPPVLPEERR
jgi:hypothetical protein